MADGAPATAGGFESSAELCRLLTNTVAAMPTTGTTMPTTHQAQRGCPGADVPGPAADGLLPLLFVTTSPPLHWHPGRSNYDGLRSPVISSQLCHESSVALGWADRAQRRERRLAAQTFRSEAGRNGGAQVR